MSTAPVVVTVNDDLTKAVQDALNPEAIRAAVLAEAEKQGTAAVQAQAAKADADRVAAEAKAVADAAKTPEVFKRTEVIGGREFEFEASSELDLATQINNAYRVAYAVVESHEPSEIAVDPTKAAADEQAAAEAEVARKTELELKFKRGDISASEYIEQSGAMGSYLEKQGISVDKLKAAVEQTQSVREHDSWAEAAEEFKRSAAGSDWPGGDVNLKLMGLQLAAMDLVDTKDKVAAMAKAYNELKAQGILQPYQAPADGGDPTKIVVTATPVVPVTPVVVSPVVSPTPRTAATSSSLFGASSGVSAAPSDSTKKAEPVIEIPSTASPDEILEAWKKEQMRQGKNPDDAFKETFAARRVN